MAFALSCTPLTSQTTVTTTTTANHTVGQLTNFEFSDSAATRSNIMTIYIVYFVFLAVIAFFAWFSLNRCVLVAPKL